MIKGYVWRYPAKVLADTDGDTVKVELDMGIYMHRIPTDVRLLGLYSPEKDTPAGVAARDYARSLLPVGSIIEVYSKKLITALDWGGSQMSLMRILGDIHYGQGQSLNYAADMIAAGHGSPVPAPGFGNS